MEQQKQWWCEPWYYVPAIGAAFFENDNGVLLEEKFLQFSLILATRSLYIYIYIYTMHQSGMDCRTCLNQMRSDKAFLTHHLIHHLLNL